MQGTGDVSTHSLILNTNPHCLVTCIHCPSQRLELILHCDYGRVALRHVILCVSEHGHVSVGPVDLVEVDGVDAQSEQT